MRIFIAFFWVLIAIAIFRGLFVLDMGASSASSEPIASAICLVGGLMAAIAMVRTQVGR